MDERAAVGAGLDFIFRDVGEGDACDPFVALRKCVPEVIDEELKRLDEGVRFSGARAGFDEEALPKPEATIDLVQRSLAGLLGRVHGLGGLNHRGRPPRRETRGGRRPVRAPR